MIAYPIAYPMGSDRPYPNRPRIARIESARVVPFSVAGLSSMTSGSSPSHPGFEVVRGLLVAGLMDGGFAESGGGVR